MIRTAIRASWLNLKRDRLALVLTFVVPIIFFTVFATIFSSMSSGGSKVKIFVVDEAQNSFSTRIHKALEKDKETFVFPSEKYLLNKLNTNPNEPDETELTAKNLEKLVSDGHITLGVVLPQDFKISFQNASEKVKVFADTKANPIAYQMINGILQKVAMTHAPGAMFGQGIKMLEQFGGELTKQQSKLVENLSKQLASNNEKGSKPGNETVEATKSDAGFRGLVTTEILDVREQADQRRGRKNRSGGFFLRFRYRRYVSALLNDQRRQQYPGRRRNGDSGARLGFKTGTERILIEPLAIHSCTRFCANLRDVRLGSDWVRFGSMVYRSFDWIYDRYSGNIRCCSLVWLAVGIDLPYSCPAEWAFHHRCLGDVSVGRINDSPILYETKRDHGIGRQFHV